jgi:Arc/MetJ-type ribon-helix-helix transcriptional regulator
LLDGEITEAAKVTIQITRPEVEALIKRRLETGAFKDAEDVILQALRSSEGERENEEAKRAAIQRLRTFGKTHGLSLGGMTIRELRHEARP